MKRSMKNYPASMRDERIYQQDCLSYSKLVVYIHFQSALLMLPTILLYVIVNLFSIFYCVLQIVFAYICNICSYIFSQKLSVKLLYKTWWLKYRKKYYDVSMKDVQDISVEKTAFNLFFFF